MQVGVPMGFCKPLTRTPENPCPWMRVRVLMGMGAGYAVDVKLTFTWVSPVLSNLGWAIPVVLGEDV